MASEFQIRPDLNSKRPQNTDGFYLMGDEPADVREPVGVAFAQQAEMLFL